MDYIYMKKISYFSTTGNSRVFSPIQFYVLEATGVLHEPNRCELFFLVGMIYLWQLDFSYERDALQVSKCSGFDH